MGNAGKAAKRGPLNKGKLVGPKTPFNLKDIWALRVRFQMEHRVRELALFNLGVDSKLRDCDLVALRVRDVCHGDHDCDPRHRHAAQDATPGAVRDHAGHQGCLAGVDQTGPAEAGALPLSWPAHDSPHLGTRQHARILGTESTKWAWTAPTMGRIRCGGQMRR